MSFLSGCIQASTFCIIRLPFDFHTVVIGLRCGNGGHDFRFPGTFQFNQLFFRFLCSLSEASTRTSSHRFSEVKRETVIKQVSDALTPFSCGTVHFPFSVISYLISRTQSAVPAAKTTVTTLTTTQCAIPETFGLGGGAF